MHPSLQSILRWFEYDHLPEGLIRDTSKTCHSLAHYMAKTLPSNPELVAALRSLLQAKDGFVRSAVLEGDPVEPANA